MCPLTVNHAYGPLRSRVGGGFSASPRVSTFLSTASRFQVSVHHVAGAAILPSDYASRHAAQCDSPACQVCSFVCESMVSIVCCTDVADIRHFNLWLNKRRSVTYSNSNRDMN